MPDKTSGKQKSFKHKFKVICKNLKKLFIKLINKIVDKFNENKLLKYYVIAIVGMIIIFIIVSLVIGGADSVVNKYSKGLVNSNAKKMYSTVSSKYVEAIEDDTEKNVLEDIEESLTSLEATDVDYLSYKIVDSYTMTDSEVQSLEDDMSMYAPNFDLKKIKKAKRYLVKYKVDKSNDIMYMYTSIYIIKTGFTWSVVYNV